MDPRVTYRLDEHGWAAFDLSIGDRSATVGDFGYCTDALGDLLRAALDIAAGGYRAKASFDGEPFEWRLILQRDWNTPGARILDVQILTFADLSAFRPDEEGKLAFEGRCEADALAAAVATAAETVWTEFGPEGYNARWQAREGFPLRALRALRTALGTDEPEGEPAWLKGQR